MAWDRTRTDQSSRRDRVGARLRRAVVAALVGLSFAPAAVRADPLIGMPDTYFPLGVFYQPASAVGTTTFAGWKARGVNTLMGYEQQGTDAQGNPTVSIDQWSQAAVDAGLYMMRQPRANPGDDASQQNLIALLQPDEPDGKGIAPSVLQANYAEWTAATGKPVVANFDGSRVLGLQGSLTQADYAAYSLGADWVAQDIYPVTGFLAPNKLNWVGQATATTIQYSGNKPTFAFIETSNQRLFSGTNPEWGERGVTPAEMRFEIWDAIVHGAKGIFYFTQSFNGFRYDATPPDVAAEMAKQNAVIAGLAPALNTTSSTDQTAISYANGKLEGMFRTYKGVEYLILLNTAGTQITASFPTDLVPQDATLEVLGENRELIQSSGVYTDDFDPYGVHVYAVIPDGVQPLAIPEPASLAIAALGATTLLLKRRRPA